MTVGSCEGYSDLKVIHCSTESPYAIRRFVDCEAAMMGPTTGAARNASQSKILERSEFKSYNQIQNWKNFQDFIPYNFDEACFNMS